METESKAWVTIHPLLPTARLWSMHERAISSSSPTRELSSGWITLNPEGTPKSGCFRKGTIRPKWFSAGALSAHIMVGCARVFQEQTLVGRAVRRVGRRWGLCRSFNEHLD